MIKKDKKINWCVYDCETDSFDGLEVKPFIWGVLDSAGDYNVFYDTSDFVNFLRASDYKYAYAHNGGNFDLCFAEVFGELEEGKIMLINGRIAKAKIGNVEMRDSWLILPVALEASGEKMVFDYDTLKRERAAQRTTVNRAYIERYLRQDCVSLFNFVSAFVSRYGFALTQAGAAMSIWEIDLGGAKRRYGKTHNDFFRTYYFGGRCEVFEHCDGTEGDFELYDINSSYPHSMTLDHPLGTGYYQSVDFAAAPGASFWTVKAVSRGAFPLKTKTGLIFPADDEVRDYHVTGWEIRAALDTGTADIFFARGLIPTQTETLKTYVDKFFAERVVAKKNNDKIGDVLAKTLLNSLYGKYASNCDDYRDYKIVPSGQSRENGWHPYRSIGDVEIIQKNSASKTYYDTALAASITGSARAKLWRAICASERVIYCDTDSVLCEKFGGVIGDKIGEWKLENRVDKIFIAGKKCYAFRVSDATETTKGVQLSKHGGYYKVAHKGVSRLDATCDDVIVAAGGIKVVVHKSAPKIKLGGEQIFQKRTMQIT